MKAAILIVLIFTAAILFAGCGHYGMHRNYNDNWHNRAIPGFHNMNGNRMGHQGLYMNGNAIQSQETYGR